MNSAPSKTQKCLKKIRFFLFKLKLFASLSYFLIILALSKLFAILKKVKLLIFLYIILFIQVLLIVFFPKPTPPPTQITDPNHKINQTLNLQQIKTDVFVGNKELVVDRLQQYQNIEKNPAFSQLEYRDVLINQAILNLVLGNENIYLQKIMQAKQLDPNWESWK